LRTFSNDSFKRNSIYFNETSQIKNACLQIVFIIHLVSDVVDYNDAVSASVITRSDGSESLLAGCVPDLQLDCLAIQLDGSDFEVDANGANVALGVRVVLEGKTR
jgi:hypothetical protein